MPRRPAALATILDNAETIPLPHNPHPIIAAWVESDRQEEERARKEKRQPYIKNEDTAIGRRKLRICNALFRAADARGYALSYQGYFLSAVSFTIDGRDVQWWLREETRPRRVPLSKTEINDPGNIAKGIITKQIRVPTGMLKIMAKTDFGKKAEITERPDNVLEQRVDEVFARFKALAESANIHEIELARQQGEWKLEKRAKERGRRLNVMEDARWNHLRDLTRAWQEAKALRAFIDAIDSELGQDQGSGRAKAWLKWARERVEWLDPLSNGRASARRITNWRYSPHPSEYELTIWDLC